MVVVLSAAFFPALFIAAWCTGTEVGKRQVNAEMQQKTVEASRKAKQRELLNAVKSVDAVKQLDAKQQANQELLDAKQRVEANQQVLLEKLDALIVGQKELLATLSGLSRAA